MISEITSASNPVYKSIKALRKKKGRDESGLFIAEGEKCVRDALEALPPYFSAECIAVRKGEKYSGVSALCGNIYIIADNIFDALCDTKTPQGILAVIRVNEAAMEKKPDVSEEKAYIYCDRVSDPGNIGTIIRTADAGGMDGVLLSPECADPYSPKTVRAAMGSLFHIPVYKNITVQKLKEMSENGCRIISSELNEKAADYRSISYTPPLILALGNEAGGISGEVKSISSEFVRIPIPGRAESLNVSIAGAVLIYEFVRNKQK